MKIIVGLGNPGKKYEHTRHNVGFKVVEALAQKWELKWETDKQSFSTNKKFVTLKALKKTEGAEGAEILLVKPQTFMNLSGEAVQKIVKYYKTYMIDDLWVIHDDVDIPLGKMKIRIGGSGAGHHGVESIIESLGTDQFVRFRLGIGKPGDKGIEEYVVRPFEDHEKTQAEHLLKKGVEAVQLALKEGLEKAMNKFNG